MVSFALAIKIVLGVVIGLIALKLLTVIFEFLFSAKLLFSSKFTKSRIKAKSKK